MKKKIALFILFFIVTILLTGCVDAAFVAAKLTIIIVCLCLFVFCIYLYDKLS